MKEVTTIELDLAKTVFQVHGVDAAGAVVVRRSLRRRQVLAFFAKLPRCLVGIEACATAHYWARELAKLGHDVRLIPAAGACPRAGQRPDPWAKAYVRRNKNDPADAAAICEAVSRPSMRFVEIKTEAQQAAAGIHRVREMLVKQRTMPVHRDGGNGRQPGGLYERAAFVGLARPRAAAGRHGGKGETRSDQQAW